MYSEFWSILWMQMSELIKEVDLALFFVNGLPLTRPIAYICFFFRFILNRFCWASQNVDYISTFVIRYIMFLWIPLLSITNRKSNFFYKLLVLVVSYFFMYTFAFSRLHQILFELPGTIIMTIMIITGIILFGVLSERTQKN